MKNNYTPESFRESIQAFQKSRILLTAFELKIFSLLETSCMNANSIAKRIKTNERGTERLLNSLTALGLLEKTNGVYSNSVFAAQYLVESSPDYMSGIGHSVNMWLNWSKLTEVVKTGKPAATEAIANRGTEWLKAFIGAMHNRAKHYSDESINLIDLSNVNSVLDVGGGSAAFSMSFIHKKNSIKATVFDLPEVIPLTKEYILRIGMEKKITTASGDYNKDQLPIGYDLVYLSAIIHSNSFEENSKLIIKCANSLNPGGQLVIQDYVMDEEKTSPVSGALFAINMLVATDSGDCYTENEIKQWFENANLKFLKNTPAPLGNNQIIATKS